MPIACEKCVPLSIPPGKRYSCPHRWPHGEEDRLRLLRAYYDELDAHEPWQRAIAALWEQLKPIPLPPVSPVPPAARPQLEAFVATWHLPSDRGVDDLWASVSWAEASQSSPRLRPSFASWSMHPKAMIQPVASEPFEYDILWHSPRCARRHAREVAKAVERNIVEQLLAVEKAAKAAGFGERAPHYKNSDTVRKAARRLFLHVIRGKSWWEVAVQTPGARRDPKRIPVRSGPGNQARRLAELLNIPLPARG